MPLERLGDDADSEYESESEDDALGSRKDESAEASTSYQAVLSYSNTPALLRLSARFQFAPTFACLLYLVSK